MIWVKNLKRKNLSLEISILYAPIKSQIKGSLNQKSSQLILVDIFGQIKYLKTKFIELSHVW